MPHVTYPRKEQKNKVSLLKPDSKEKEVKLEDFTIRIFILLFFSCQRKTQTSYAKVIQYIYCQNTISGKLIALKKIQVKFSFVLITDIANLGIWLSYLFFSKLQLYLGVKK